MAKPVEIIGPSGSGKTAIYRQLRANWKEEYNWVAFDDLYRSKKRLRVRYARKLGQMLTNWVPGVKSQAKKAEANPEWNFINYDNLIFLGDDYRDLSSILMDLVEEHSSKWYDGSDKRFVTIYMLMWSIAHFDKIITHTQDDRYCILKECEGFISRIMHLNSPSFDEQALDKYLANIPYPSRLIFLDVPTDKIMDRIKKRDRMATLHKGMSEEDIRKYTADTIRFFEIAMKKAEEKGTDVYRVDASGSLEETIASITGILSKK